MKISEITTNANKNGTVFRFNKVIKIISGPNLRSRFSKLKFDFATQSTTDPIISLEVI